MKVLFLLFSFILIFLSVVSCGSEQDEIKRSSYSGSSHDSDSEQNEIKKSSYSGSSHNSGQNCMICHRSGGRGEYIFTVAGTVYDKGGQVYSGARVKLYTGPNGSGELRYTLEVDRSGNFYTTESINFGQGLYPSVEGRSGSVKHMPTSVSTGECNSCHDQSRRIWMD